MPKSIKEIIDGLNAKSALERDPSYVQIQDESVAPIGERPTTRVRQDPPKRSIKEIIDELNDSNDSNDLNDSNTQQQQQPVTREAVAASRAAKLGEFKQEFKDVSALPAGAPKKQKKQNELLDSYFAFEAENDTAFDTAKKQESFAKEAAFITKYVGEDNPQRDASTKDFVDRYQAFEADNRIRVLKHTLTRNGLITPGKQTDWQSIRRTGEAFTRFGSTIFAGTAQLAGKKATADYITKAANDLNEYNNLLDRNTVLGKKYGPLFGQISSSLVNSTLSAVATGGLTGVAAIIGIDEFNVGMEEAKDMEPIDQWQHAAAKAAIGTGTTLAGGALAAKAGVASGETLVPFAGKVFRDLFTRSGLMKTATAAIIEGGEEGMQTLLTAMEDVHSGVNPNAADNLFDDVVQATAVGALVGGGVEHLQNVKIDKLRASHLKDLTYGWVNRLKPGKLNTDVKATADPAVNIKEDGTSIRRSDVTKELEALQELETEVEEQRNTGASKEVRQELIEQKDALASAKKEVGELKFERDNWIKGGLATDSPRVKNLDGRIKIVEGHLGDTQGRINENTKLLSKWSEEYDVVYKEERAYLDSELERLATLREMPDNTQDVFDKIDAKDAANQKTAAAAESTAKAPATEKGIPAAPGKTDSQKAKAATDKFKQGEKPPTGKTYATRDPQFDVMHENLLRARQKEQKFMRKWLGMDDVEARKAMSTKENFKLAEERGLAAKALDLATEVVFGKDGKILNSVELAGLQTRYVRELKNLLRDKKYLKDNEGSLFNDDFDARMKLIDSRMDDIDLMTQAWIKSSSDAGAALQAQKRIYGERFSVDQAVTQARRLKSAPLTSSEIDLLNKAADSVTTNADKLAKLDKDNPAFDQADQDLYLAQLEYKSAIKNFRPGSKILKAVEGYNAVRMALTLAGDLVPFGRQGWFPLGSNPVQSLKISKDFFKVFANKTAAQAEHQAFLVERGLRNMEYYNVLTKKYGTRQLEPHTAFNDVEGSAIGRMSAAFSGNNRFVKGAKKILNATPLPNFDIAYRAWLNSLRMKMADRAYRQNKYLLSQPGGELEMQKIIDHTMSATGHSKQDIGSYGTVLMTAPRWFLSRLELSAAAPGHLMRGAIDKVKGKQSASRFIARQYVNQAVNMAWMQAALTGVASVMLGPDQVEYDFNPVSPTYGYLKAGDRQYDLTGGTGFVVRQLVKGVRGAYETMYRKDNIRDADAGKALGNTLISRASPIGRDLTYAFQSMRPAGSNDEMAKMEYLMRNVSWLTWQGMFDAARDEGLAPAALAALMEGFGSSGFESKR